MSLPAQRFVHRSEPARQATLAATFRARARSVARPPRCERLMRRPFGRSQDSYRRGVAGAIRMKELRPLMSWGEVFIHLTGPTTPQEKDGALFPAAGRIARIKKPVFHELHDDWSSEISDQFDRRQRKARLHQLFISLTRAPCVHINLFFPHRCQ